MLPRDDYVYVPWGAAFFRYVYDGAWISPLDYDYDQENRAWDDYV